MRCTYTALKFIDTGFRNCDLEKGACLCFLIVPITGLQVCNTRGCSPSAVAQLIRLQTVRVRRAVLWAKLSAHFKHKLGLFSVALGILSWHRTTNSIHTNTVYLWRTKPRLRWKKKKSLRSHELLLPCFGCCEFAAQLVKGKRVYGKEISAAETTYFKHLQS
jgi:hypothetical protein